MNLMWLADLTRIRFKLKCNNMHNFFVLFCEKNRKRNAKVKNGYYYCTVTLNDSLHIFYYSVLCYYIYFIITTTIIYNILFLFYLY